MKDKPTEIVNVNAEVLDPKFWDGPRVTIVDRPKVEVDAHRMRVCRDCGAVWLNTQLLLCSVCGGESYPHTAPEPSAPRPPSPLTNAGGGGDVHE